MTWEYYCTDHDWFGIDEYIDELGSKGWELVSASFDHGDYGKKTVSLIMKRRPAIAIPGSDQ